MQHDSKLYSRTWIQGRKVVRADPGISKSNTGKYGQKINGKNRIRTEEYRTGINDEDNAKLALYLVEKGRSSNRNKNRSKASGVNRVKERPSVRDKMDAYGVYSEEESEESIDSKELAFHNNRAKSPRIIENRLLRPSEIRANHQEESKYRKKARTFDDKSKRKQRQEKTEPKLMVNDELYYDDSEENGYNDIVRKLLLSPRQVRSARRHEMERYQQNDFLLAQQALASVRGNMQMPLSESKKQFRGKNMKMRRMRRKFEEEEDEMSEESDYEYSVRPSTRTYQSIGKSIEEGRSRKKLSKLQKSMSFDTSHFHPVDFEEDENYGKIAKIMLSPNIRRKKGTDKRYKEFEREDEIIRRALAEKELFMTGKGGSKKSKKYLGSNLRNGDRVMLERPKSAQELQRMMVNEERKYFSRTKESTDEDSEEGFDWNSENCDDLGMLDTPNLSPGYEDFCDILYDNEVNLIMEKSRKKDEEKKENIEDDKIDDRFNKERREEQEMAGYNQAKNAEKSGVEKFIEIEKKAKPDTNLWIPKEREGSGFKNGFQTSKGLWYHNDQKEVINSKEAKSGTDVLSTVTEELSDEWKGSGGKETKQNMGKKNGLKVERAEVDRVNEYSQQSDRDRAARELFLGIRKKMEGSRDEIEKGELIKEEEVPQRKASLLRSLSLCVNPTNLGVNENEKEEDDDENYRNGMSLRSDREAWKMKKAFSIDCGQQYQNQNEIENLSLVELGWRNPPEGKIIIQKTKKYHSLTFTCSNEAKVKERKEKGENKKKRRSKGKNNVDENNNKDHRNGREEKSCKTEKGKQKKVSKNICNTGECSKMQQEKAMEGARKKKLNEKVFKGTQSKSLNRIESKNINDNGKQERNRKLENDHCRRNGEKRSKSLVMIQEEKDKAKNINYQVNDGVISDEDEKRSILKKLLKNKLEKKNNARNEMDAKESKKTRKSKQNGREIEKQNAENSLQINQTGKMKCREEESQKKAYLNQRNDFLENALKEENEEISDEETKKELISKLIRRKRETKLKKNDIVIRNENKTEVISDEETKAKLISKLIRKKKDAKTKEKNDDLKREAFQSESGCLREEEKKLKLLSKVEERSKKQEKQEKEKMNERINDDRDQCPEENRKDSEIISDEENKMSVLSNLIRKKRMARKGQQMNEEKTVKGQGKEKIGKKNDTVMSEKSNARKEKEDEKERESLNGKSKRSKDINLGRKEKEKEEGKKGKMKTHEKKSNAAEDLKARKKFRGEEPKETKIKHKNARPKVVTESSRKMPMDGKNSKKNDKGNIQNDLEKKKSLLGPLLRRKIQAREEKKMKEKLDEERMKALERVRKPVSISDNYDDYDDDDGGDDDDDDDGDDDDDDDDNSDDDDDGGDDDDSDDDDDGGDDDDDDEDDDDDDDDDDDGGDDDDSDDDDDGGDDNDDYDDGEGDGEDHYNDSAQSSYEEDSQSDENSFAEKDSDERDGESFSEYEEAPDGPESQQEMSDSHGDSEESSDEDIEIVSKYKNVDEDDSEAMADSEIERGTESEDEYEEGEDDEDDDSLNEEGKLDKVRNISVNSNMNKTINWKGIQIMR